MAKIGSILSSNTVYQWQSHANKAYSRLDQFAVNESTLYANTISANVSLLIKGQSADSRYANTVQFNSALANTNVYIATKVNTSTFNSALANTNAYIAYVALNAGEVSNSYLTSTYVANTAFQAALANTNIWIDTKANIASPTFTGTPAAPTASSGTNTTQIATTAFVRTEISNLVDSAPSTLDTLNELAAALGDDANFATTIASTYQTKTVERAALANTNAYIATKVNTTTFNSALANTNSYIATVQSDVDTNEATELSHLANTNAYIATKVSTSTFNSALANTNAYIAYVALTAGEVSNSYLTSTYVANTAFQAALANTNAYIASVANAAGGTIVVTSKTVKDVTQEDTVITGISTFANTVVDAGVLYNYMANTNAWIDTKVNTTTFNSALANTNAYIAYVALTAGEVSNSYLTSTYVANSAFQAALANTNAWIDTKVSNNITTTLQTHSIIPAANNTYDLGSPDKRFNELYLTSNSIILGTTKITADVTGSLRTVQINDLGVEQASAIKYVANAAFQSALSNTNAYIATKVNTSTFNSALANTNAYIAYVATTAGEVSNSYLTSTYVANTAFQSFVANTNAYIALVAANAAITLSNDTSTSGNVYPLFASATSGKANTIYTSNSKLTYEPATGALQASEFVAHNGFFVGNMTINDDYTWPAGYSAVSVGPITVANGATVTIPAGSRWVVL